jgi:hypothetical protein
VPPPSVANPDRLQAVRSAYLIVPGPKDRGTSGAIQRAFERHGVQVRSGLEERKPADVDALIRFSEVWRWDLKLYLENLDVDVVDAATERSIASGTFRNSYFHSYPDLDETARQVVDGMYAPPQAK